MNNQPRPTSQSSGSQPQGQPLPPYPARPPGAQEPPPANLYAPAPAVDEGMATPVFASPGTPEPARNRRPRRLRSYFWPGFVLGFLLLTVVSCGGMVMATGISRLDLADLQENNVGWSPPPTPVAAIVTPSAAEPVVQESGGLYAAGDQVRNITASQVNIRAVPGYLGKPNGDVTGQVPPGAVVEILGGRAEADNLTWWRVRYRTPDGATLEGWMAEATASGVQIIGR